MTGWLKSLPFFLRIERLFQCRAGGEGDDLSGRAFDLLAGREGYHPGRLALDAEDAEAAEFHFRIGNETRGQFVEKLLNDAGGGGRGKLEPDGDLFCQVAFDHGVSGSRSTCG